MSFQNRLIEIVTATERCVWLMPLFRCHQLRRYLALSVSWEGYAYASLPRCRDFVLGAEAMKDIERRNG